ncbi:YIP1 family protein [Tropicimonas sp.]|uniref:YIP1 family protein n=1 Tax=Tropicimonas sp. TaxID=2067044 RepID=UPI003A8B9DF1
MTLTRSPIRELVLETLRDPRVAARRILAAHLPLAALWEALALVVVLSVLTGQVATMLVGGLTPDSVSLLPVFFFSPFLLALVQGVLLVVMVAAVYGIGRAFGGQGQFAGALALVTWLQFLMVCLQVLQGVALVIAPLLSTLLGLAGVVAFFYLLTIFICELHGFTRPGMVFAGILATLVGMIFILSILLGILGIGYVGVPDV